jgi:hypothetical protein
LNVAFRGIDRYFERYYAKGPRRRPVRIEFCEADVLDVFDDWRRAVGVREIGIDDADTLVAPSGRRDSLAAHLDKVIARLTARRAADDRSHDALLDDVVRELDTARNGARTLRGEARARFLERLRALDRALIEAVRSRCDPHVLEQLAEEANVELSMFRDRMPPDAYERSLSACVDRLLRERSKLPTLTFD